MKRTLRDKLQEAAKAGNIKAIEALIPTLDAKTRRADLTWAMWSAVMDGNLAIADLLLQAGANPNGDGVKGDLFLTAASYGNLPIIKRLIEAGADIHRWHDRQNAFGWALLSKKPEAARYLKSLGVEWATPTLFDAVAKGDLARVKKAIAAGANLKDRDGWYEEPPLMLAARKGHAKIVCYLLKHGANPNAKTRDYTPLMIAAGRCKDVSAVDALIEAGADLKVKYWSKTVLMFAAGGGCLPIVKRLVELGADVHAREKHHGTTALDCAKAGKHDEVIAFLTNLGATSEREPVQALARLVRPDSMARRAKRAVN